MPYILKKGGYDPRLGNFIELAVSDSPQLEKGWETILGPILPHQVDAECDQILADMRKEMSADFDTYVLESGKVVP